MSKSINSPQISLRDVTAPQSLSLVDRMLQRGQNNLAAQGIDVNNLEYAQRRQHHNPRWEDLIPIREELRNGLADHAKQVYEIYAVAQQVHMEGMNELMLTIQTTFKDLDRFSQIFVGIEHRHAGCSGAIGNEADQKQYLSVFNDYSILTNQVKAIMFPAVITFTEFQSKINAEIRRITAMEEAEKNAQDRNVVTDVQFTQQ